MILAHKVSANVEARIWAASYDPKRDAFRVALEDRQIFLLQRPIPEDDHSEVLEVYIEGNPIYSIRITRSFRASFPWRVNTCVHFLTSRTRLSLSEVAS